MELKQCIVGFSLASAATLAVMTASKSALAQQDYSASNSGNVETVVVTAQRLAEARNGIQTQLGASTYTITAEDIKARPAATIRCSIK